MAGMKYVYCAVCEEVVEKTDDVVAHGECFICGSCRKNKEVKPKK